MTSDPIDYSGPWSSELSDLRERLQVDTASRDELATLRARRDSIIAREVHGHTPKDLIASLTGLGVPQINRIARTTVDAVADGNPINPGTVSGTTPAVDAPPRRRGFDPAPAGGHVPPRARRIRSTGSTVSFGHASEMGYPKVAIDTHAWVSRCDTHSTPTTPVDTTVETRSEARYLDGTTYCLDCAAAAR